MTIKEAQDQVEKLKAQLSETQLDNRMLKEEVTAEDIAGVVSRWTGVPVTKMIQSEREKLLYMETELHKRVAGQEEAIEAISDAIRRSRAGLQDKRKPIGSFIFLGTTGVGKTELAKALAEYLFNDEHAMIRIDMSEYQERHAVSRLIGAPPGYVGYDEGGQLTEQVKNKPYSVILFDEIEKANKDIFSTLLQVLDDGHITDGLGRKINFKNCVIIMTSNIGVKKLQDFGTGVGFKSSTNTYVEEEYKRDMLKKELKKFFAPEFLNRIDEVVIFNTLKRDEVKQIVKLEMDKLCERLVKLKYNITYDESVLDLISEVGFDETYGARPLKRAIQDKVEDFISEEVLKGTVLEDVSYVLYVDNTEVKLKTVKKTKKKKGEN
jgi:ATP-dependent Clp protease ATP-binding subunit ClpB